MCRYGSHSLSWTIRVRGPFRLVLWCWRRRPKTASFPCVHALISRRLYMFLRFLASLRFVRGSVGVAARGTLEKGGAQPVDRSGSEFRSPDLCLACESGRIPCPLAFLVRRCWENSSVFLGRIESSIWRWWSIFAGVSGSKVAELPLDYLVSF